MGKKYYNDGIHEKRIEDYEIPPAGWVPGRVCSSATTTNCIWINNGVKAKFIPNTETIPDGWKKGRLKSHLNPKAQSATMKAKHFHHYTDGIHEIHVEEDCPPPDGYVRGRPPMTADQKEKLAAAHTGLHHTEETKQKISEHSNNNRIKAMETILHKYGSFDAYYKGLILKGLETKRKNNTLNTSQIEKNMYYDLCESYGKQNVLRQYKEDRYPFYCDFYIKSEDLFIELNAHWTHGGKPYDPEDKECQEKLTLWKEKAKTSQYFSTAIQTWTVRDVEKQRIAKQNNLNYTVIY